MNIEKKIRIIRSFGYWIRVCDDGSPVRYIIVDPNSDEQGWMVAGDEDILDLTIEDLECGGPETEALIKEMAEHPL